MKKTLLTIVCAAVALGAGAQDQWSLGQCVEYAVQHNIDIKQQRLEVENQDVQLNTSKNSRLPNLSAGLSQSFNFGRSPSMATGIYEPNTSSGTSASLSASVPVFNGMRINNQIKSGELNLLAATEGLKKAEQDLSLTIASYYLDALFKKEILNVAGRQLALTRRQVERTGVLVEAGSIPRSNLYDMEAQVARDEAAQVVARNDLSQSLLNLALLLNVEAPESFDIMEPDLAANVLDLDPEAVSPDEIYQSAIAVKPHVKEAEYRLEGSKRDIKIAQSSLWPSISLGMSYNNGVSHIFDNEFNNVSTATQLKNNQREAVGLSVGIPIFNRLQTRNQIRTAKLGMQSRELELERVKLSLYGDIRQAYSGAVAARAKYISSQNSYTAAEQAYRYAEESYHYGKSSVYEFIEAQTRMIVSLSEQLQAKYDFIFRIKILDFYRGMEIDI